MAFVQGSNWAMEPLGDTRNSEHLMDIPIGRDDKNALRIGEKYTK